MAPTSGTDLHYRLFAKLLMFLTLFLGAGIGYASGFQMGQQNAIQLLQEGKLTEQTTANQSTATTDSEKNAALSKCYEETLGTDRYAKITDGSAELTVDEVFELLPCTNLAN